MKFCTLPFIVLVLRGGACTSWLYIFQHSTNSLEETHHSIWHVWKSNIHLPHSSQRSLLSEQSYKKWNIYKRLISKSIHASTRLKPDKLSSRFSSLSATKQSQVYVAVTTASPVSFQGSIEWFRGYSRKFYMGRLCREVQPLTLLYSILTEKLPVLYTFYWWKSYLFHILT